VSNFQWVWRYSCLKLVHTDPIFDCGDGWIPISHTCILLSAIFVSLLCPGRRDAEVAVTFSILAYCCLPFLWAFYTHLTHLLHWVPWCVLTVYHVITHVHHILGFPSVSQFLFFSCSPFHASELHIVTVKFAVGQSSGLCWRKQIIFCFWPVTYVF